MTPAVRKAESEARAIVAAIALHGGCTVSFLAFATQVMKGAVERRLRTNGPNAMRPAYRWFRCDGGKWFLTAAGEEMAKAHKSRTGG